MFKYLLFFSSVVLAFAQDYRLEPIGTGASGLPAAYGSVIESKGHRITGPSGVWCEVWFRTSLPTGPKPADSTVAFPIAQGTLVGILRFPAQGADRRDQAMKPGVYTLRYSQYPVDGAHQGVAPQRDFVLLTPIAGDPDPNAAPDFEKLVALSKTSGTGHAAVLSLEAPTATVFPSLTKEGDHDTVLNVKIGSLPVALIVAGKAE